MQAAVLRRRAAAVLAALVVAGSLWVPAGSAQGAPAAACTSDDGVTVVVDFGGLGGGMQIRCVDAAVTSGFDALEQAGFSHDVTQRVPGLLCRIDGKPADDPCVNAPPPSRYWAYWTASEPGGAWTYSTMGAGNRQPPPGSVEGWAWTDGCARRAPGTSCAATTTTTTTTTGPATSITTTSTAGGPAVTAPQGGGATSTTDPGAGSTPTTAGRELQTTSSTDEATARAPLPGEEGDPELAASSEADPSDDGSPLGVMAGAALIAALGGATWWRRRGGRS